MKTLQDIASELREVHIGDFRADHTISGLNGFILPDYFDPLSASETGLVYEAVVAILDGKESFYMDLNVFLEEEGGSPIYYTFVRFLFDSIFAQRDLSGNIH